MPFVLPPLYPILDAYCFPDEAEERARFLDATVRDLTAHGVTLLQLRMKHATRRELLHAAQAIRAATPSTMRLILNDHVELVQEAAFDGVHLGQADMPVAEARERLGAGAIIGVSTHTPEQLARADASDADYVAAGPVFATSSKSDAEPVIGLEGVSAASQLTCKPLVAIGGITIESAEAVWAAGAGSVAVISALFQTGLSPGRLAGDFLRLFR